MPLLLKIVNADKLPEGSQDSLILQEKKRIKIGRAADVDWRLSDDDNFISANHCEIRFSAEGYFELDDLSTNGTFLDGEGSRLPSPYKIKDGDRFRMGPYIIAATFQSEMDSAQDPSSHPNQGSISFKLLNPRGREGASSKELKFVHKPAITIGRDNDCDICLEDDQRQVSRLHCEIVAKDEEMTLIDRSRNGTFFNNVILKEAEHCALSIGDQIGIGTYTLIVLEILHSSQSNPESVPAKDQPRIAAKRGMDPAELIPANRSAAHSSPRTNTPQNHIEEDVGMTRIASPMILKKLSSEKGN